MPLRVLHDLGELPVELDGAGTGVVVGHASDDAGGVRQSRAMTAGEWVSTGEAAEVLEVPMRELYELIDTGQVEARRRGPAFEVLVVRRPRLTVVR